jgi:transposase
MSTSLMYHTQGIRGFQHKAYEFGREDVLARIGRESFQCGVCRSGNVKPYLLRTRKVRGLPIGEKGSLFEFEVYRLRCEGCGAFQLEPLDFLSHPKARITKAVERQIVELRREMSITALAKHFQIDWRTVKEVEKRHLARKYAKISMKDVRYIGIDEICVGHGHDGRLRFLTVVRDNESGAVLFVGEGKGGDALAKFKRRLRKASKRIEVVTMDMSSAFIAWVEENLPKAEIVFDHFHVIKLVNDRLDKLRRTICAELDEERRKDLKGNRFILLKNMEDLDDDGKARLNAVRNTFRPLADAHALKESLRSIYAVVQNETDAGNALLDWCVMALATGIPSLESLAKTIDSHRKGILAFWRHDGMSNASMEGFNSKIRWLNGQARGYRDYEYLKLKIYDLPSISTVRQL